jgi:TonB family protein
MIESERGNALVVPVGISLAVHLIVAASGHLSLNVEHPDPLKEPETEFIVIEEERQSQQKAVDQRDSSTPPPYIDIRDQLATMKELVRPMSHRDLMREAAKAEADIPLESDLIMIEHELNELKDHPAYINYYEKIRETIRNHAFAKYNRRETGRIKLTFTITSEGELSYVTVNTAESVPSTYLQKIALDSMSAASPFPSFPEELKDYTALTFSVTIHFRT